VHLLVGIVSRLLGGYPSLALWPYPLMDRLWGCAVRIIRKLHRCGKRWCSRRWGFWSEFPSWMGSQASHNIWPFQVGLCLVELT
jgi:hypothetical protein